MGVEIGELKARLTAESHELKAEIKNVKKEFSDLGEQAKKTGTDFKSLDSALNKVGSTKDQINKLASVLDNVNARIDIQKQKLVGLKASLDKTFNDADKFKLQDKILKTEATMLRLTQTSDITARKMWTLEDSLNQVGNESQQTSRQVDKMTDELREVDIESGNAKQGINGLASGLAALGAGAATVKLANTFKTLADEAQQLTMSYTGLGEVSKSFNVDTGASIDLAEKLSDRWGLNKGVIADTVKTYLAMNMSLEEAEKMITATADAAVYNRQAHLSWDEAIKQVAEGVKAGNSTLTDAAGITTNLSVMQDRYAKSIGTTAAKLTESQKIQAAYNGMLQEASLFAGNADSAMTGYTGTQATFSQTMEMARVELGEAFLPVLQEVMELVTPMIKDFALWSDANKEVVAGVAAATIAFTAFIAIVGALSAAFIVLNTAMGGIGIILTIIGAVAAGVTSYGLAANAASDSLLTLASNQEELNKKLNESPMSRSVEDIKKMQGDIETLNVIMTERASIQEKINELQKNAEDGMFSGETIDQMYTLQEQLSQIDKTLEDMDFETPEQAAEALKRMREEVEKSVPALLEMEKAELQDVAAKNNKILSMEQTIERYKQLDSVQKLDEAQKQELVQITNTLKAQYPDLHALMDEEGRIRIENIDTIGQQIGVEKQLVAASVETAKATITNLQQTAAAQKASVEAQILNYQKLLNVMASVSGSKPRFELNPQLTAVQNSFEKRVTNDTKKKLDDAYEEQNRYAAAELEAKRALASLTSGNLDDFAYKASNFDGDSADEKKKKTKTGKTAAELAAEKRKEAYELSMATARYQADYYDQTAEDQIKAYEKIKVKHKQYLAESLEDERSMNLLLKRLQEDTVKSHYEISSSWVDAEDRRMEESGKSEVVIAQMKVDAWTRVRDRYDKDSEYYEQADDKLYQSRKALIQALEKAMKDLYSSTSDFIKQEERQMEESGASETEIAQMKLELWTRIRDSYEKDSEYYKEADEQVYQAKKNLISRIQNDNEAVRKVEKQSITDAKELELDAIADRKKAYTDDIDERIAAIDRLIKAEDRLNSEQDYESQLAEKKARQAKLEDAVSPEGRQEYADITAEIERMELEHSRDVRKQNLEDQKEALQDEKSEREQAFDKEKSDAEEHYDALTLALDNYQDDVNLIETAIKDFRIDASQTANSQILSDLDSFISSYNSKLASLTAAAVPSQQESDLQEYNNNKDAWSTAKASGNTAEMDRLTQRNETIRKQYGISQDTGKLDHLPSFDVGGRVPGPLGAPMQAIIHGGEAIFNPQQLDNLFRMLEAPGALPVYDRSDAPQQPIINQFDMSVGIIEVNDAADAEILYTERERTARRLATGGVK